MRRTPDRDCRLRAAGCGLMLAAMARPAQLLGQGPAGAFIARQGQVQVARERYRFADGVLASEVEVPARGIRLEARTEYNPGLAPTRYRVAARGAAGPAARQELEATLSDSIRWTVRVPGRPPRDGSNAIGRPFGVLQNLMFSHLALILRRYLPATGGVQVLDVWLPEGNRVAQLRMSFQGDSGTVELGGVQLVVRLGRDRWLRSVRVPAQSLAVDWSADLPETGAAAGAGRADTAPPAAVRESWYAFTNGSVGLEGTLTVPAAGSGPVPAAVIVGGSGATDRNGNNPPLLHSNLYAQLAWRLAERGIASLRYDKRGIGASRAGVDYSSATLEDFASDLTAAARSLHQDSRFGPVVLVGHGEGAWLAMRAANGGAPVAGIALLSGLGRSFAEGVREQLAYQIDSMAARRFEELFPRYLAGEDLADAPEYLRPLLLPINRSAARSLAAFDPRSEMRKVSQPVLIVQGVADIQAGVRDAELLRSAKPDALLAIVPRANHVFKEAESTDRAAQLGLYTDPTAPVVPALVEIVAGWVKKPPP